MEGLKGEPVTTGGSLIGLTLWAHEREAAQQETEAHFFGDASEEILIMKSCSAASACSIPYALPAVFKVGAAIRHQPCSAKSIAFLMAGPHTGTVLYQDECSRR